VVALPLGAWSSALALDLARRPEGSRTLTGLGALAAVPAVLTGLSDWADTEGAEKRVGTIHLSLNALAIGAEVGSWWARRRGGWPGVALGAGGVALASTSGWLGGHLAYSLGVGVDTNAFSTGPSEWTPVGPTPDHDSLEQRTAGGTPLVVARDRGRVTAMADRCSHRGGPLSDGSLEDGCAVCPWHGSRFDVVTGAVRRGPATVPQPTYELRTAAGGVEVRRDEPRALRTNAI
jgi:nitrite reductase/ring-hydroxylating ferredoxin subunit/uncharacterized membrane protein